MNELNKLYLPDYQEMLPIPESGSAGVFLRSTERDYLKDKDALPTNDNLPPDHLTATYWG
jgi:hypothetical protein